MSAAIPAKSAPDSPAGGPFARRLRDVLLVAAYNVGIALLVAVLTEYDFATSLVFANCIGFSIYAGVMGSSALTGRAKPGLPNALFGIPFGFAVGFALAAWLSGLPLAEIVVSHPRAVLISGAAALMFGVLGTWHFHDAASVLEAQADARAERLRRAEQEAAVTHAELARLQAQIEPHFLFNTLSNVVGLVDTDPAAARRMLIDLTALLRTSLARTRQREVTLNEELELLRAYLAIMGVRMGARLDWSVEADDDLLAVRLPPLLVQPLAENAIRHGLEPKTAGGRLTIRCRSGSGDLLIDVEDDGLGFAPSTGAGVGLANVRERLRACYGDAAALTLEDLPGGGVRASIRVPMEPPCAC